jgi:tetraacyldisaccharide 4'-kinase
MESTALLRWSFGWISIPYGWVARLRAGLYGMGWLRAAKLPCPVVSVGNLTLGGSGKTPVTIFLTQWLMARGKRVAVLSRGYRRSTSAPCLLVSDGRDIRAGPVESGDEPYLIASRCRGAVVAVGPDRAQVGRWVLERFQVDYLILDDGYQHLPLHRDVDLLLVDASNVEGLSHVFPRGQLREPLSAARRASAVLFTRADSDAALERAVALLRSGGGFHGDPIRVTLQPAAWIRVQSGEGKPVRHLAGASAVMFSGIANPDSFRQGVESLEVKVQDEIRFRDHHHYRQEDIRRVRDAAARVGAATLVTTEKDAVKVASLLDRKDLCWALRLETVLSVDDRWLERLLFLPCRSSGEGARA